MISSKLSLSIFSVALLLVLPNCLQTNQTIHKNETISDNTNMIKLFVYPTCPYCHKVINFLRDSGNLDNVLVLDASTPQYFAELKQLTNGNTQCPFIFDEENNVKMHESKDIIKYFQKIFAA